MKMEINMEPKDQVEMLELEYKNLLMVQENKHKELKR